VSVLTPVLNEAAVVEQTVPTMLAQRLPHGEIEFIFAEGNSNDGTREILERFAAVDPRIRVISNPTGRTPDGLNLALAHARGDYVARMDAHCFYPETYLADGIARLVEGDVAWVAGPADPRVCGGYSGAIALAWASRLGRGPSQRRMPRGAVDQREFELGTSVFLGVWRRSTLERYGGWDPRWLRNQDSELAARFLADGERIVSLPAMAAELFPRRTLRAFARQYHGYGRYRARTLARHPVARKRMHTLGLAPALTAALPAAVRGPRALRTPARSAVFAYATAIALETARAARAGGGRADVARLPAAFAAMHIAFGAGMWRGLAEAWLSSRSDELHARKPR
jgi:glycosyltransferase involved in cell wall biosynthesis